MIDEPPPPPPLPPTPEPIILFRNVCPTDLNQIYTLEKDSYPADEKASRAQLQYRQHHAAAFFRCAVMLDPTASHASDLARSTSWKAQDGSGPATYTTNHEDNRNSLNGIGKIIGFVTGTRCRTFDKESMRTHNPAGKLLAIHSVVVSEEYRKKGIGTQILENYLQALKKLKLKYPIEKVVLITKMQNIGFYLRSGFGVLGKSKISHGEELWYDCELKLDDDHKKEKSYECWIMDSFAITRANANANGVGMVGIGGADIVTSGKGTGNPAAVVLINDGGQISGDNEEFDPQFEDNQEWMKIVAREFNLSETAFIWKKDDPFNGGGDLCEYYIRYYTCDGSEVDLCGHATLAASSVVFQKSIGKRDLAVIFHAKYDVLKAKPGASKQVASNKQAANGGNGGEKRSGLPPSKIIMEFPSKKTVPFEKGSTDEADALAMIKESLFPKLAQEQFDAAICEIALDSGGADLLVELTADGFASIPKNGSGDDGINFKPMKSYNGYKRGVIVCCVVPEELKESGERADFFSRFFGPKVGIEEDPVTGSAHCVLGPYFGAKLQKDFIIGSQRSERGGIVECTLTNDKVMRIAGSVTKAMSGKLFL